MNPDRPATKDRYPGLCSFEADEHRIFFGRSRETAELLQLVRAEQVVVLFSKSGLGKSSLLSAGLFPKLMPLGYYPIRVRFQQENAKDTAESGGHVPLQVLHDILTESWSVAWQQAGLPEPAVTIPFDAANPKLWEQLRARPFPNGLIPILVFDQFEEFFAYPLADQQAFASQLAELMHDQAPARVINWLLDLPAADRTPAAIAWSRQPAVKCIMAIRSDRLAEMHSLKPYITLILRNRYELGPLREEAARDAIDLPARLDQTEGPFATPAFSFDPVVREEIIRTLSNENCEIEGSQLQIVCQHVESRLKEEFRESAARTEPFTALVDRSVISGEKEINRILDKFYRTQLRTVGDGPERAAASHIIENELVEGGRRVGLSKAKMLRLLGDFPDEHKKQIIQKLQLARLIRCETTHLGETYELSHDSLVEPVEKVRSLREALVKRRQLREESARKDRELREQAIKLQRETRAKELAIQLEREKDAQLTRIMALQAANADLLSQANLSRRRYKRLTYFFALVSVGALVSFLYWYKTSRQNKRLFASAIHASALPQYERGRHGVAFRLWNEIDSIGQRPFAAYVGRDVRMSASRAYVGTLYADETLEIRQRRPGRPDTIVYKARAAAFRLAGHSLAVYQKDTVPGYRLRIIDLKTGQDNLLAPMAVAHTSATALSDDGRYAVVVDNYQQAHLYQLTGKPTDEVCHFLETLSVDSPDFSRAEFSVSFVNGVAPSVVVSSQDRLWVYDLRQNVMRYRLTSVAAYQLSMSGNRLAVVTNDQLVVYDLGQGTVRLLGPRLEPFELITIQAFSPDESAVLIHTQQPGKAGMNSALHVISLRLNQRTLWVPQAAQHWVYPALGQLIYTTRSFPGKPVRYDLAGQRTLTPWPGLFSPVLIGTSHGLFRQRNGELVVRDMRADSLISLSLLSVPSRSDILFYAADGRTDSHLLVLYRDSLRVIDLQTGQSSTLAQQGAPKPFGRMSILGDLVRIRLGDRILKAGTDPEYWCFFIDQDKNRPAYLCQYVYPALTEAQRKQFGLLKTKKLEEECGTIRERSTGSGGQ
ncbi:hypothetical protein [Spirosoma sp. 209]|uniref:nSTAND1 domain-containing NTPase n=1 Tax=Spirosoma sp. 209 TaxID=1955701 RepID=UPI00098D60E1|nr:hypothetical protein [Spirosoma sp. 209]